MLKRYLKNIAYITLPSLLIFFFLLELVFRFIIPARDRPNPLYDQKNQIVKFDTNYAKSGIYTSGKLAQQRSTWRINNMGWNSAIDYVSGKRNKPLIAIIGDSMTAALQVDPEENISARLREMLQGTYEVYGFGYSGAPLSQYLQISRYVENYFKPDILVFNVMHNDFDESLCVVKWKYAYQRTLCLEETSSGIKEVITTPYVSRNPIKPVLRRSSLVRYLFYNLGLETTLRMGLTWRNQKRYEENVNIDTLDSYRDTIVRAVDYILRKIRNENPDKRIFIMMDAPRLSIYNDRVHQSNLLWLHQVMEKKCHKYELNFIDLTDPFKEMYKATKIRFESEHNYHWNENGHSAAALVLYKELRAKGIIY